MTEEERELRAVIDARKDVHANTFVPVRLGVLRMILRQIGNARPEACPAFLTQSEHVRDGCARCGLPKAAHAEQG